MIYYDFIYKTTNLVNKRIRSNYARRTIKIGGGRIMGGYKEKTQTDKNIAWFLPRPKKDRYKGGMPLYCEEWIIALAKDLIGEFDTETDMLNLFCGKNKYGCKIDIKPSPETNADIVYDAHKISEIQFKNKFKFIFADPPYSTEEAKDIYGTPPLKYKKWTAECDKLLDNGGLLCVYHKYVMPNPNPLKYDVVKRVFIGNRTYHLPRVAIYFRKK